MISEAFIDLILPYLFKYSLKMSPSAFPNCTFNMLSVSNLTGITLLLFLISVGIFSIDLLIRLVTEILLRSSIRFVVSTDL